MEEGRRQLAKTCQSTSQCRSSVPSAVRSLALVMLISDLTSAFKPAGLLVAPQGRLGSAQGTSSCRRAGPLAPARRTNPLGRQTVQEALGLRFLGDVRRSSLQVVRQSTVGGGRGQEGRA
ncbi:unnamed protein product, partial [Choristocarpus tenellus]